MKPKPNNNSNNIIDTHNMNAFAPWVSHSIFFTTITACMCDNINGSLHNYYSKRLMHLSMVLMVSQG